MAAGVLCYRVRQGPVLYRGIYDLGSSGPSREEIVEVDDLEWAGRSGSRPRGTGRGGDYSMPFASAAQSRR